MNWVIGIDEVGRGPIAGPVTVCALAIRDRNLIETCRNFASRNLSLDSKKLSPGQREKIVARLKELKKIGKLDYKISSVAHTIIDKKGIVWAVNLAISRSLTRLTVQLGYQVTKSEVLLDGGLRAPKVFKNQKTITRGDSLVPIIGLASVLAKVHRDKKMTKLGTRYPAWDFAKHKGYGTGAHYAAIGKHGLSPIHRTSYLTRLTFR